MTDKDEILKKVFSRFLTGFTLSKAMLEDYAKVVAKLDGISEEEVISRVRKRSDEIFEEIKVKQLEETEKAENSN